MSTTHAEPGLTVLQAKFAAYLAWSQPFIHALVSGVGEHVHNVVVCNRTENLDRFPTPRLLRFKYRFLVEPSRALLAAAYLRRSCQPDLIHAHFGWSGIRMLLLKQLLRVPMITTFGGRDASVQMQLPYFDQLYRLLLASSEAILCVSEDLRQHLIAAGVDSERIEVVRRGTNVRRFEFVDRRDRDPATPLRVLMVGRLIEKKCHPDAFRALASLVAEGQDIHLIVVGEGDCYRELRRLRRELGLQARIEFKGVMDQEGVRSLMAEADVFLHCSVTGSDGDREGIPNVVVEAAATGLPVIGTLHGGIPEAVEDGVTGLLVKEHDDAGLTVALGQLAKDRELRLRMGHAGHVRMKLHFDAERQVARHVEIYRDLSREFPVGDERTCRRMVPPDFTELLDKALSHNEAEFSLAELFERLTFSGRLDAEMLVPEPGLAARIYDVKNLIPQEIKWPAKGRLGRLLSKLIALRMRYQRPYSEQIKRIGQLDELVIRHMASGGGIDGVDSEWDTETLARFLLEAQKDRRDDPPAAS